MLLSLSTSIEENKNFYYEALEKGQRNNKINNWLFYFTNLILNALDKSELIIDFTLKKASLFDKFNDKLNDRQLKVIKRLLKEGINGFEGGMTTKKYVGITKTSKPTATRDLQNLLEFGVFKVFGKGRSASYQINFEFENK